MTFPVEAGHDSHVVHAIAVRDGYRFPVEVLAAVTVAAAVKAVLDGVPHPRGALGRSDRLKRDIARVHIER